MTKRALAIAHHGDYDPGLVGDALNELGYELTMVAREDGVYPDPRTFDLIVPFGSAWSVPLDHAQAVAAEQVLLRAAHNHGVPIFGVCFGAQQLAASLGGSVRRSATPEIGWVSIDSTNDAVSAGPWFQFHLDEIVVPDGADVLATTSCVQAFRIGRSLGVQFHPEISRDTVARWLEQGGHAYLPGVGITAPELLAQCDANNAAAPARTSALIRSYIRSVSRRPLIGITGRRWPTSRLADHLVPAMHDAEFDLHFTEYPAAVARAGGLPVELARDAPVAELLERLDGVVVSGGADVDPSLYGATPDENLGYLEPERDLWELEVIAHAIRLNVPLLGICRGAQLINVHLGGTLVQHVGRDEGVGHPRFSEPRDVPCHLVRFVEGTLAYELYGHEAIVNSLHHQTISDPPAGVVVSGVAPDGVIEAIELRGRPVLGVQWHPEMLTVLDPSLVWLIEQATQRANPPVSELAPNNQESRSVTNG